MFFNRLNDGDLGERRYVLILKTEVCVLLSTAPERAYMSGA